MTSWLERATAIGLSGDSAALAARHFDDVASHHAHAFGGSAGSRAWWVPGRIEVLGKHTDYGGGRSLLCAIERGFHVVATPRPDAVLNLVDVSTHSTVTLPIAPDTPPRPGHWTDYPISVVRRVARDFPGASMGMDITIRSSLPSASGLSSSTAMVIACFLPLAAMNDLRDHPAWQAIADDDALAEYLGAMENGRAFGPLAADRGVGTQGGCEDQTAILRSIPGRLLQYHFLPVTREATVPLPAGWQFIVAMSGVHAAKGGAVQARYNALAGEVATLLALWGRHTGRSDRSLFAALRSAPDAAERLARFAADEFPADGTLGERLAQFATESDTIIPAVVSSLQQGDVAGTGSRVAQSQSLAESALRNQIAETSYLAKTATTIGAAAASAFGAGFGGSVWALIRHEDAPEFTRRWRDLYLQRFTQRRHRAEFFSSLPGPPATEL